MAHHAFIEREKVEKTDSGIILPGEDEQDRQHADTVFRGKVVALGEGDWGLITLGCTVIFMPVLASEIEVGEERWVFSVPLNSVLAVEES
jgi:co-chaperonin GroES (HSP10)